MFNRQSLLLYVLYMKKNLTLLLFLLFAFASIAQNNIRVVKGFVQNADGRPLPGIMVKAVDEDVSAISGQNGAFELRVSPYCRYIEVSCEGYLSSQIEVDGSIAIFRLKVDKKYLEAKAKAEEEARIAAQKQAEAERIAKEKEAAAKAKAEEAARIAAQKQAEAERVAKEKEAAAKAKAEEEARIAAQKQAEAERIAKEKEAAAKAKAEEAARIAAQKQAEAERIAKEKAEIAAAKKEKRDALRIEYAKPIKGYESFVNISYYMTSNESFVGADYIGGYRFNNIFFLGAGVGANMRLATPISQIEMNEALELSHGAFYLPVYAHFRAQLLNRRCAPFLALSAGYNISLPQSVGLELTRINYNASGVFVNPQFGITYRIKPKLGIYCAAGFNACMMPECIGNTGYSATIKQSFKYGININLGISF